MNKQSIQYFLNSLTIFSTFTHQIMAINPDDVSEIHLYVYEAEEFNAQGESIKFREFILIVYKNGATDRLPATPENKAEAKEILRKIRSAAIPK